jgi:hypothetical protein
MHENRATSRVPASKAGGSGKANNHNPDMNDLEESDCAIVPMKQTNKGSSNEAAEVVEERAWTKENDAESHRSPTRSGERMSQGLGGVRQRAREL